MSHRIEAFLEMLAAERGAARNTLAAIFKRIGDKAQSQQVWMQESTKPR